MSFFEDELKNYAPGMPKKSMQILEAEYGNCTGFCIGLDVFSKILLSDALPKNIPAFGEPWKSIYADTVQIYQAGGGTLTLNDAQYDACAMNNRPNIALNDAITKRQTAIAQAMPLKGSKKTSDDYKTQLSMLGYDIKLNLAGNKIEINGELQNKFVDSEIRNAMKDSGFRSTEMIQDCINSLAKNNEYHPIQNYLNSLKWDGVPRIESLAKYFHAHYNGLFPIILRKWLIGSIVRIFNREQNSMLVFEGKQGLGKDTFARWLCPIEGYFKEGSIDPDNKDHRIATSEIWIWEVGELGSTTRKADREALKNFLTTRTFIEREVYGRHNQPYTAMASFIGSVNNENGFLNDPTGSRRFWVMPIDYIDWDYSKDIDVNDIWAEAMAAFIAGEDHNLDDHTKNSMEIIAEDYKVLDATEEAIRKWFYINPNDVSLFTDFNTIRNILKDPQKGDLQGHDLSSQKIAAAMTAIGLYSDRKYITVTKIGHAPVKQQVRGYVGLTPL